MLSTRSLLLATTTLVTTLGYISPANALFSFNSTLSSNGITIKDQAFNGIIPEGVLSDPCAAAYSTPVNCSSSLMFVGPLTVNYTTVTTDTSIPETAFETLYRDVCTEQCYTSLQDWRTGVLDSCSKDFDELFSGIYGDAYDESTERPEDYPLPIPGAGADVEQFGNVFKSQERQWLNWIFWQKCLQDLNTTTYCTLTELDEDLAVWPSTEASRHSHLTKEEALDRNQTFCDKATCFMQYEMIDVLATGMFQGENATQADVTDRIQDMCPDINTNTSFPFLQLGVMYPFDDAGAKVSTSSTDSGTDSHGADGIVDLSGVNATSTSGSSAMPMPVSMGCLLVAGLSLLL